jgi:MFS family permease
MQFPHRAHKFPGRRILTAGFPPCQFNRSICLWLVAFGVVGFTYFGVHAVLFSIYLLRLGFEPRHIGLLIGSGQVVFALMALPAGELGRRYGVRGAFITGLVVLALAYGVILCVEALPRSAWVAWLLVWWVLMWAGAALANVNSVTYAMGLAGDAARARLLPNRQ